MELYNIIGLVLVELVFIGVLICMMYMSLRYGSRFGHIESVQRVWPDASQEILAPHSCKFLLWLIYGVGFNCLARSVLYTALQLFGVLNIHIDLGFMAEYVISCISTFVGSFIATALYKFEGGSLVITFAVILALCILPTGLLKLILESENTSAGAWVLWPVSIVCLSLSVSFVVFKYITLPTHILSRYSLEEFKSQSSSMGDFVQPETNESETSESETSEPETSEPETREQGSNAQGPAPKDSEQQDSTQETPTLPELIERGYTLNDVLVNYSKSKKSTKDKKKGKHHPFSESIGMGIFLSLIALLPTFIFSGIVESYAYQDWENDYFGRKEYLYFHTLLLVITQLVSVVCYGYVNLNMQCSILASKTSVTNWGWYVLFVNFFCFIFEYLKDTLTKIDHAGRTTQSEFIANELLRVPFKFAAVGLIFTGAYYIVCLRKARKILSSIEPHELEELQTV